MFTSLGVFQDGSLGNIAELAQEYSAFYGTSLSDVSDRMDEIRKRKVVQDADTVSNPPRSTCVPSRVRFPRCLSWEGVGFRALVEHLTVDLEVAGSNLHLG